VAKPLYETIRVTRGEPPAHGRPWCDAVRRDSLF